MKKDKSTVKISVRLPPELYAQLKSIAISTYQSGSVGRLIKYILVKSLECNKNDNF